MKTGKTACPSGIVAEMLKASGDTGARLVTDLANDMVRNGVIPSDWEDSFIINIYKGTGGLNELLLMQDKKLDVVDSFCYLGDTIGAGGGCDLSVITRIRSAWGKFRELLPILTSPGQIYSTYIRTVLLYASECWAPNVNDLLKLQRNYRAMIRRTCNVRLKDHISSDSLLRKLGINNIQTLLRYNRLRWFGHVVRNDGCINSITEFEVVGQRGRGRPKKTWKDTINNDLRHWKLSRANPANRMFWVSFSTPNIGAVRPTLSGTDTLNEWWWSFLAFGLFYCCSSMYMKL